ncbi:MAG TPA: SMP-30/gluconolactonase/LRE family protein [Saprospiraceae bacterium]|nr:SMP-30/gluconolactonase/LRE family protein [Saprospiraceae bacterium]HRK80258.1 SMP-30/gluconolactonase/LRE family protein [Saprospiraceae bacterium]
MKTVLYILALLILIVAALVVRTLWYANVFKTFAPQSAGNEQLITGMIGAEDITMAGDGIALVSSYDRRGVGAGKAVKGAIFRLDLNNTPPTFTDLTAGFDQPDFRPHGISLYTDPADGTRWLFAVNHRAGKHVVEIFEYRDSVLIHSESIESELFKSPNDLVGYGKRSFYFTNDHNSSGEDVSHLKDFLVIGTGEIGRYENGKTETLATGIRYANGITISPDGKLLYVAACTDRAVYVYNREPFEKIRTIDCGTGVDNLEWDEEGNLWIGAHPKLLMFLGHSKDPAKRSLSQVLQIQLQNPEQPVVKQVYLNDGNPLSGSSVATVWKNKLLVGGVFDDGVLVVER